MEAVADWQQRAGTPQSGMLRTPGHRSAPSLSFSGASLSALKTANAAHVIEQQLRQIESLKHLAVTKGATSQMVELAMKRRQPLDRQRWLERYTRNRQQEFVERYAPGLRAIAAKAKIDSYDDVARGTRALKAGGQLWRAWSQPTIDAPGSANTECSRRR